MTRTRTAVAIVAGFVAASVVIISADVKTDEKSQMKFEGAMGKVVNLFAGKATRNEATVALKGNRKASITGDIEEIVDLSEDKVYALDLKKKTYTVTTFDELRHRMEEVRQKAAAQQKPSPARSEETGKPAARDARQPQIELEVDVKNTGQTKSINGFETREVLITISAHDKGKTLNQAGGLLLTESVWMAPKIGALRELAEFDQRYARKLASAMFGTSQTDGAAAATAMYPMLQDVVVRMRTENAKIDGSAILTTTTVEGVQSPERLTEQQKQNKGSDVKPTGGLGGMLGGIAGRMGKKKTERGDGANGRTTIMTMTHEVLSVAPDVSAADLAVPEGFRLKQ
jgi:hypothetical protein